jgi:hypothetical protein
VYLLDTNIVSLLDPRPRPEAGRFVEWARRNDRLLFVSAITLTEIETGILKLVHDGKRERARQVMALRDGIIADYGDRVLALDVHVALAVARLGETIRPAVIELADLIIAATAQVHNLTVLTRNVRHFARTGLPVFDPVTRE